jgi:LPPG:FO 2-phospho-L-lactate transferase
MRVTILSGGVGGARMARGFERLPGVATTVIVNVGDDNLTHGLRISPDLDTVIYTLAAIEGPHGWGRKGDTFSANEELGRLGFDNTFQLGDRDLALKIYRTAGIRAGLTLSAITETVRRAHGIESRVLPATDDDHRTEIRIEDGGWISFQEYFVHRRHEDDVVAIRFAGKTDAAPAPGVIDSIRQADILVIAPSNPPLSIWPILAVAGVRAEVAEHPQTTGVSPLIGGKPIKGPADRVLSSLGLPAGAEGVLAAYEGLLNRFVIDNSDVSDNFEARGVEILSEDIRIGDPESAERLARAILER